jgi:hypothetical protein
VGMDLEVEIDRLAVGVCGAAEASGQFVRRRIALSGMNRWGK